MPTRGSTSSGQRSALRQSAAQRSSGEMETGAGAVEVVVVREGRRVKEIVLLFGRVAVASVSGSASVSLGEPRPVGIALLASVWVMNSAIALRSAGEVQNRRTER
jgi:hypothetical protein